MIRREAGALGAAVILCTAAGSAGTADPTTVQLYRLKCQSCHLADGKGSLPAMDFSDGKWIHGGSQAEVVKVISEGVRGTAMVAYREQLTPRQIAALARFVRSFDKTAKAAER